MFSRPTFLSETHVVPNVQIWPLSDDGSLVEVSLMLPHSSDRYAASYKSIRIPVADLPQFILDYAADPEEVVASRFGVDTTKTNTIGPKKAPLPTSSPTPKPALAKSRSLMDLL